MSIGEYDRKISEMTAEIRVLFDLCEEFSKRYQDKINEREALIASQIPF